ncbi:MAG: bacteriohemerythrin [Treponema sp.]
MQNFVSWDPSYDVGVDSVDRQHRHLVSLINNLYNACLGEKAELEETFREVMKELVEYVMIHFKDEETIMESISYPTLKEHKQKHELFVKEILHSVNAYKNGKQFVPNSFVRFLRDWLFNHILIDDKEWAKYYFSVMKN